MFPSFVANESRIADAIGSKLLYARSNSTHTRYTYVTHTAAHIRGDVRRRERFLFFSLIHFKATRITYCNSSDDLCSLAWRRVVLRIIIITYDRYYYTILFFLVVLLLLVLYLLIARHLAFKRRHLDLLYFSLLLVLRTSTNLSCIELVRWSDIDFVYLASFSLLSYRLFSSSLSVCCCIMIVNNEISNIL